jgi:hypothetical protein
MVETVIVQKRFNGPLDSGNGGYCAGLAAGLLDGAVEASLRRPVPLDTPLDVRCEEESTVQLLDGDGLVVEAHSVPGIELAVPAAVSVDEAREATSHYRAPAEGVFSHCFVCGRAREDAFGVFAGAVEGRDVVASPWTPPAWTVGDDGACRPEFVWAVLDCPTYFALYSSGDLPLSVLARLTARIDAPVITGTEHVVIGWPIEKDGRKHHAASAVLSADGRVLAIARALLIAPRDE